MHKLNVTTFPGPERESMTTLGPTNMNLPGIVRTGLAWDEPSKTAREAVQGAKKAANELTSLAYFTATTGLDPGTNQGSLSTEVGANHFCAV